MLRTETLGLAVNSKLTRAIRKMSLKEKGCKKKKMISFMSYLIYRPWKVNYFAKPHKSDGILAIVSNHHWQEA